MDYLLTRFSRDMASLMVLLRRLDRFSLAERRMVTVSLLKKMVAEEAEELPASVAVGRAA